MKIDRRDLKWRARDAMRAARPNALLMTFLYLLLTAGLGLVVDLLIADPLSKVLELYQQGITLDRAIPLAVSGVGSAGLFLNILMAVYGVVMDFGYRCWCLNTARGEQGEAGDLIGGFAMVGRILWMRILILIYGFLWYLVIFMPAALGVVAGAMIPLIGPLISLGVFVVAGIVYISRVLRYVMTPYCLADEPDMGASWALRCSCRMMEGKVGSYFVLRLSFLGWMLLNMLIVTLVEGLLLAALGGPQLLMGMDLELLEVVSGSTAMAVALALASWPVDLWLVPYVVITECKFYERIKGTESTQVPF